MANLKNWFKKKKPYVFTEQSIAMLSALLKSETAIKTSIFIMNAFVTMRKYILNNLLEQKYINGMVFEHDERIKLLEDTFSKFDTFSNEIFFEGQIYDAYSLLLDIFNTSKESIIIIDNNLINKYNCQYYNVTIKINNSFHDR